MALLRYSGTSVLTFFRCGVVRRHGCLVGILCILLLLIGTTVQVSHSHLPHENHADCSLCATAHAVVQVVTLPTGFVAPVVITERRTYRAARVIPLRIWAHPLWNRPPPSSTLLAEALLRS